MKTDTRYLIERLHMETGIGLGKSKMVWRAIEKIIEEELVEGHEFHLRGLFTLKVVESNYRTGYNKATKETVVFPPKKRVKCKIGKILKDAVRDADTEETEED